MNKFLVILGYTYGTKVKSKSFVITTLVIATLIIGLINLERIIDFFEKQSGADQIAVITENEDIFKMLQIQLEPYSEEISLVHFKKTLNDAEELVALGEISGILQISLDSQKLPEAIYKANLVAEQRLPRLLEQALQQIKMAIVTDSIGIAQSDLEKLYAPVSFERIALTVGAKTEEELHQARLLVNILVFVIYFSVLFYGNMIAMEVATEKSSRVMEILISSVSPVIQMFAKIIGVALVGLTQQLFILFVAFISLKEVVSSSEQGELSEYLGLLNIPFSTIVYAIIFFLLGYLLFATLSATLGSLVSRIEDVNQVITPVNLIVIAAFIIAMFGLQNPESTFITVTSYIPFFAPMIMFLRIGMLAVPFWEIALVIGILVITITVLAIVGARVYRGGVLMYGKTTSFKDIKKALLLTKKEQ